MQGLTAEAAADLKALLADGVCDNQLDTDKLTPKQGAHLVALIGEHPHAFGCPEGTTTDDPKEAARRLVANARACAKTTSHGSNSRVSLTRRGVWSEENSLSEIVDLVNIRVAATYLQVHLFVQPAKPEEWSPLKDGLLGKSYSIGWSKIQQSAEERQEAFGECTAIHRAEDCCTLLPAAFPSLLHQDAPNVVDITLPGCEISWLQPTIGQMTEIRVIDLSDNKIKVLPEELGQLVHLWRLNLSDNKIKELPEALGQLASLKRLNVNGNPIERLPESLGQCGELVEIQAGCTQIRELPESLTALTQLRKINLRHTPYSPATSAVHTSLVVNEVVVRYGGSGRRSAPSAAFHLATVLGAQEIRAMPFDLADGLSGS